MSKTALPQREWPYPSFFASYAALCFCPDTYSQNGHGFCWEHITRAIHGQCSVSWPDIQNLWLDFFDFPYGFMVCGGSHAIKEIETTRAMLLWVVGLRLECIWFCFSNAKLSSIILYNPHHFQYLKNLPRWGILRHMHGSTCVQHVRLSLSRGWQSCRSHCRSARGTGARAQTCAEEGSGNFKTLDEVKLSRLPSCPRGDCIPVRSQFDGELVNWIRAARRISKVWPWLPMYERWSLNGLPSPSHALEASYGFISLRRREFQGPKFNFRQVNAPKKPCHFCISFRIQTWWPEVQWKGVCVAEAALLLKTCWHARIEKMLKCCCHQAGKAATSITSRASSPCSRTHSNISSKQKRTHYIGKF